MSKYSIVATIALAASAFSTSAQAHCGRFGQIIWLDDKVSVQEEKNPEQAERLRETFYNAFCLASGFKYEKGNLVYSEGKPWTSDDVMRMTDVISFKASFAKINGGPTTLTVKDGQATFMLNPFQSQEQNSTAVYKILEQLRVKAANNKNLNGIYSARP